MHYYSDDGFTFTSKIQAIEHGKPFKFYYHDDVWSNLNWSIEPPLSIEHYYKEYAQIIRESYDYVILCYSGGYDSTNILETFYYNNIPLDKIIIVGALSQDSFSGVDENHNGELYHNAFPVINNLGLSSITETFDYTKLFEDMNSFSVYSNEDWIHQVQGFYSPHNWFWYDLEKYVVPNNKKDKKVAVIFGKDKPKYDMERFWFSDKACLSYAHGANKNETIERINFYWEPDYPLILIKQVHMLKNVFDMGKYLTPDEIVYNLKNPLIFKSPKSTNSVLSLRDYYLIDKKNTKVFDYFKSSAKRISQYDKLDSLLPVLSKKYTLC